MRSGTLEHWAARGWVLDPSILNSPGEVINTGGGPYYIGENKEAGYGGTDHPIIVTRYLMGTKLGRPLTRNELVRFRTENKKDFRLSNLILHSKNASAAELFKANGDPILGYSHCMCGCGSRLDLEKQKNEPYAYEFGHRPPSKNDPKSKRRARPERKKVLFDTLAKVGQPLLDLKEKKVMPATIPIPEPETDEDRTEEPLKEFRALFEKMIRNLPWDEFKELLHLLLEIQTRKP